MCTCIRPNENTQTANDLVSSSTCFGTDFAEAVFLPRRVVTMVDMAVAWRPQTAINAKLTNGTAQARSALHRQQTEHWEVALEAVCVNGLLTLVNLGEHVTSTTSSSSTVMTPSYEVKYPTWTPSLHTSFCPFGSHTQRGQHRASIRA